MSEAGERILEGVKEALSVARGDEPAASITVNGHIYYPKQTWRPIETAPKDGTHCLFYSPGRRTAGNQNAREPYYRVDFFSAKWPKGLHQYPEAPYTHWMPLPAKPSPPPSHP